MPIFCSNPAADFKPYSEEVLNRIQEIASGGSYILGSEVSSFEKEFADYIGQSFGIGVANGTDGIELALRCCNLEPGDEVITVSHTASATPTAIVKAGGIPLFVDIDPETYTLNPALIEPNLSSRTKAIIPVHIYGHPADMGRIIAIAKSHNIAVIEDCAQAAGAAISGRKIGSFGDFSSFSFYPTKNLSTLGDAGLVLTNSRERYEQIRALRQYGWHERFYSSELGLNSRMDELHAAILRVRLKYLNFQNQQRAKIAQRYIECLSRFPIKLPTTAHLSSHVFHLFVIQVENRDELTSFLNARDIYPGIHYPYAAHQQPAFQKRHLTTQLPVTESLYQRCLSLPIYASMTSDEVNQVVESVSDWFSSGT